MRVLGIETSCDETGVAVYDGEQGLIADEVYSQAALHAEFGGVVPELASRDHIRKLLPLIHATLDEAHSAPQTISGIAYTAGPGLIGALLVGAALARSLAFGWRVPALPIHHMEGHLLAPMLEVDPPDFPFLALLVSGGHTMLVRVAGVGEYLVLGETLDDAAGEAFDKTAKLLGLPYPGGPELAALAEIGRSGRFEFPRPMLERPGLDFSFSGLKTSVLLTVRRETDAHGVLNEQTRADIARGFEDAVVEVLTRKCLRALDATGDERLVVSGGVSANRKLRRRLQEQFAGVDRRVYFPRPEFCTDNGAMIAYAGYLRLKAGETGVAGIAAKARWSLDSLTPPGHVAGH